jgi:predicted RNA-binding protein with PIN domain
VSVGSDDPEAFSTESAADEEDGPELPPIPDALLAPLLEAAGEALRRLPPVDLPPAARRLRSFDRRGLATPAARHQLRKLLEENLAVLTATATEFRARPEVAQLLEAWDEALTAGGDAPMALVADAAAEGRLPLLASVLIAGLPDCFEFGLGLAVAMAGTLERESEAAAGLRAATAAQETAEEGRRRAEAARAAAEAQVSRLEAVLRDERRARRDLEQHDAAASADSAARRTELEAALAAAGERLTDAERLAAAAGQRVADAERRAIEAEGRAAAAEARAAAAASDAAAALERALRVEGEAAWAEQPAAPGPPADPEALAEMARAAEDLAADLRRLADGPPPRPPAEPPAPPPAKRPSPPPAKRPAPPPARRPAPRSSHGSAPRPSGSRRRAPVRLPPGMLQDDPAAIEAMIRTPGLAVIVDGYNVSMLAWPTASAAEQRERLCDALAELHLRFRCEVTVVFDGAEVQGVRPLRRRGLRVVFSAAGQEADEVVVNEVMFRPDEVPVLMFSSDREVRTRAEAEGATTLGADALLQLMRR